MVRKLPVIQAPSGEDAEAAERPGWHWLLLGVSFVIVAFLPLVMVALALGSAALRGVGVQDRGLLAVGGLLPPLAAFALASFGSGGVVGRFALRASKRTAPVAGALAGILTVGLAALSVRDPLVLVLAALVLSAVGAAFAALGARFGRSKRPGLANARRST